MQAPHDTDALRRHALRRELPARGALELSERASSAGTLAVSSLASTVRWRIATVSASPMP